MSGQGAGELESEGSSGWGLIVALSRSSRWAAVRARAWLLTGVLVLALGSSVGDAGGRTTRVQVPRVHGDVIGVYNRLHRLGLRVSIPKAIVFNSMSPPQVVGTLPGAGRRVRAGSVVTLVLVHRAATSIAGKGRLPSYRVPPLVGGGVDSAYGWVRHKRLVFWAWLAPLTGGNAPGFLANWYVSAQRPAPTSRLALGRRRKGPRGKQAHLRLTPLSVWAAPRPPVAGTGATRALGLNTATLTGTVNPQGEATTYYFAYGTTTAYGQRTRTQQVGFGNANVPVTAALAGLTPATSYHFRLVVHSSAGTVATPDGTFTTLGYYQNPVFGPAPMPDPFVLDNGGTHSDYWAYGTGADFPMLHSDDLVHWTSEGNAMTSRPSWVVNAPDWNPWAPSVLASSQPCPGTTSNGCYVMYYVGLSAALNMHCIGVAISPTPAGPFVDQGPLDLGSGTTPGLPLGCGDATGRGNIDPSPFVDPGGQTYLYVSTDNTCPGAGPCSFRPTISAIPLSADGLSASGPRVPLFSGDPGTWEAANVGAPTVEGPAMELHNGTYYLFYSGGSWRAAYGMGYATSTSPTGPFTKSPANPILSQTATVIGPGGGDRPVTGPHGGQWLVYHGRSSPDSNPRTLRLDPLTWARNAGGPDKPVIGGPTSTPQPTQP